MEIQKKVSECLDEWGTDYSEKIKASPLQAVLLAGGIGYLLRFIPIFSLVAVILRIAFALIRPALVIFGIAQIAKCVSAKCEAPDLNNPSAPSL